MVNRGVLIQSKNRYYPPFFFLPPYITSFFLVHTHVFTHRLGLEATTDCLILASLIVITIAVLQFVYFDYDGHQTSNTSAQLYSMVTVLFAGLMFLLAR